VNYTTTPEFDRDFKKLLKRYRTLDGDKGDFELLKKYLALFHSGTIPAQDPVLIEGACPANLKSYKVRKMACKALKSRGSNSGLRVIYVYNEAMKQITFIEIYFKADQVNEDRTRLKAWLENAID